MEKDGMEKEKLLKNGGIEFEGEFLNGKKWIGKLYDENKNLVCEIKNNNKKAL